MAAVAAAAEQAPTASPPAGGVRAAVNEAIAQHDEAMRLAEIRPGDPLEAAMALQRKFIGWVGEMAEVFSSGARGLSPEGEAALVRRVERAAADAARASVGSMAHTLDRNSWLMTVGAVVLAVLVGGGGAFWWGRATATISVTVPSGELVAACTGADVQVYEGHRMCPAWIDLDWAGVRAAPTRH